MSFSHTAHSPLKHAKERVSHGKFGFEEGPSRMLSSWATWAVLSTHSTQPSCVTVTYAQSLKWRYRLNQGWILCNVGASAIPHLTSVLLLKILFQLPTTSHREVTGKRKENSRSPGAATCPDYASRDYSKPSLSSDRWYNWQLINALLAFLQ